MPHNANAEVLQVLRSQVRQDRVVYLVLAEGRLIPFEAELSQPIPEVHRCDALSRSRHLYLTLFGSMPLPQARTKAAAVGLRSPLMIGYSLTAPSQSALRREFPTITILARTHRDRDMNKHYLSRRHFNALGGAVGLALPAAGGIIELLSAAPVVAAEAPSRTVKLRNSAIVVGARPKLIFPVIPGYIRGYFARPQAGYSLLPQRVAAAGEPMLGKSSRGYARS